jgi:hypothetical protein
VYLVEDVGLQSISAGGSLYVPLHVEGSRGQLKQLL